MPDLTQAVIAVLLADGPTQALVDGRVFDYELPLGEDFQMPVKCVVVRYAGGANRLGQGTLQINDSNLNVLAYGETPHLAAVVQEAVYQCLKPLQPGVRAGTYLHWCKPSVMPIPMRDPDTQWPYSVARWEALASDLTVAV